MAELCECEMRQQDERHDPGLLRNQRIWSAIVSVFSGDKTQMIAQYVGRNLTRGEAWTAARAAADTRPEVVAFTVQRTA